MRTVTRPVYYCDHCARHRLTASSILTHEPKCIYNPERSACGWHEKGDTIPAPREYVKHLYQSLDLDWLRSILDGCPACMLAVVVQADLDVHARYALGFQYKDEVERFRADERRHVDVW